MQHAYMEKKILLIEPHAILAVAFMEYMSSFSKMECIHETRMANLSTYEYSTFHYLVIQMSFQKKETVFLIKEIQQICPHVKVILYGRYIAPEVYRFFTVLPDLSEVCNHYFSKP